MAVRGSGRLTPKRESATPPRASGRASRNARAVRRRTAPVGPRSNRRWGDAPDSVGARGARRRAMAQLEEQLRGELSAVLDRIRGAGGGGVFEEFPGAVEGVGGGGPPPGECSGPPPAPVGPAHPLTPALRRRPPP